MNYLLKKLIILLAFFLLPGILLLSRDPSEIKRSGKIYVGMTKDDINNINYPLAVEFARYLNVELVLVEITWEEAFMQNGKIPDDIETNPSQVYSPDIFKKVDIICSTFTIIEWRKKLFDFAKTLNSAELMVVLNDKSVINDFSDLKGKSIALMKGTTFESNMNLINQENNNLIKLILTETGSEAKEKLNNGEVFGIILDADEALNFNKQSNMKYRLALPVSPMSKTAWTVEKGNTLKSEVEDFFRTIENNGVLNDLFKEKFNVSYTSYVEIISKNKRREKVHRDLDEIIKSGKLIVALRDRKFIYQEGGEKQPMHALAEEFAEYLGVSLEYVISPSVNKYWETEDGKLVRDSAYTPDWFNYFDVACEIFSRLEWREKKINFVPVYPSEYSVIAKKGTVIKQIKDLEKLKCVTSKGSAYEDILAKNNLTNFYYESTSNFLNDVRTGKADYTIMDNVLPEMPNYPELEPKLSLGKVDICWGLRKDQPKLEAELMKFMRNSQQDGLISVLLKAMETRTLQSPDVFIRSYYERNQPGQYPSVFYGSENGLPQEDIFCIFQDNKGYLWLGTNSGAMRYNGREMKPVSFVSGLKNNSVYGINQDSTGIIYFATSRGIFLFDNDTIIGQYFANKAFKTVYVDKKNEKWFTGDDSICTLSENAVSRNLNKEYSSMPSSSYGIAQDSHTNDKYFPTSHGIYIYYEKTKEVFRLTEERCFSIFIDRRDSAWVSTDNGLYILGLQDLRHGDFKKKARKLNQTIHISDEKVRNINTNKYGSVWLVNGTKIYQVVSTEQAAIPYEQAKGLRNNKIMSFLIDNEDNIWIGFSGGLQRLSNKNGLRNFYPSILNSYIYSVIQDSSDKLWIASNNGIFIYDVNLKKFVPENDDGTQKYVIGNYKGTKLLIASNERLMLVEPSNSKIIRQNIVNESMNNPENIFISSKGEIFLFNMNSNTVYYFRNFDDKPLKIEDRNTSLIYQITEYNGQILGGSDIGIIQFGNGAARSLAKIDYQVYSLYGDDKNLWLGTESGLGLINDNNFHNIQFISLGKDISVKSIIAARNKNYLWLGTNSGFVYFSKITHEIEFTVDSKEGLSGNEITNSGLFLDRNNILWIGTYHGLSNFNLKAKTTIPYTPNCFIEKILLNGKKTDIKSGSSFRYNQNNFVFEISALSFSNEESIEYEFYLRGTDNSYSSYHKGKEYKAYYNNLPPGKYTFIYKAKGKNDIWGYSKNFEFEIKTAWYNTWLFRICFVILFIALIWHLYKIRIKKIEAQKARLEQIVSERTADLKKANVEIEKQRDLATYQRDMIFEQKKEITDSINYAERIQRSLLPQTATLKSILPEHFILFKPRDIVSGDFYWVAEKGQTIYAAAVDCTGHGVPGALMSMLGISFLNEIVNKTEDISPDEILNQLRKSIIKALKQAGKEGESRDGMDISLLAFNKSKKEVKFAGANNPLYHFRNNELQEYKGSKMPIGIYEHMESFTCKTFEIIEGDTVYLFSDGYADQFGGPKMKKFMYSNFKKLLLDIQPKSMCEQFVILNRTMEEWRGSKEQVDDIVVIGIRF